MMSKEFYSNGQKTQAYDGKTLKFFYKNGVLKAEGPYENQMMEGTWHFYRDNGQLAQIGNFKKNMKHGSWIRYARDGRIEYDEVFIESIKQEK